METESESNGWYIFWVVLAVTCLVAVIVGVTVFATTPDVSFTIPSMSGYASVTSGLDVLCTDCQFIEGMKDYSNIDCTPTVPQLDVVHGMDPDRIKYCGDNPSDCISEMESVIVGCFESVNPVCSDCKFKTLIGDVCMESAYTNVTNNMLQKRLYSSDYCGCTPSVSQIDLYDQLLSEKKLLRCGMDGCYPEMDSISEGCMAENNIECEDCEYTLNNNECEYDLGGSDIETKVNFSESCGCIPTNNQLNGKTVCDVTEEPVVTQPPDPTDPPNFQYPSNCSNCDYTEGMKSGCVVDGLVVAQSNNMTDKFGVTAACGCTPTELQLNVTNDILGYGQLGDCFDSESGVVCEELKLIVC